MLGNATSAKPIVEPIVERPIRKRLEQFLDRGIELLDRLDGDPDFEPEPMEPDCDAELEIG